jgi:hypothetical protein
LHSFVFQHRDTQRPFPAVRLPDTPSVHIIDSVVYHTDLDYLKVVPAYGLEQSARFFFRIIDSANRLDLATLRQNIPTQ